MVLWDKDVLFSSIFTDWQATFGLDANCVFEFGSLYDNCPVFFIDALLL